MAEQEKTDSTFVAVVAVVAVVGIVMLAMHARQSSPDSFFSDESSATQQNLAGDATGCYIVRSPSGFRTAYCGGKLQWDCGPCTNGVMSCASFSDAWQRSC